MKRVNAATVIPFVHAAVHMSIVGDIYSLWRFPSGDAELMFSMGHPASPLPLDKRVIWVPIAATELAYTFPGSEPHDATLGELHRRMRNARGWGVLMRSTPTDATILKVAIDGTATMVHVTGLDGNGRVEEKGAKVGNVACAA